jgi:hypothetical protein
MTVINTKAVQQGRFKPQWGRSIAVVANTAPQRLVSLRFDEPQDLTVYMQANIGFLNPRDFPAPLNFLLSFGTGGTSNQVQLRSAAIGSVYHVVTQSIDVDVLSDLAGLNTRVRCWCAVGSPISQWIRYESRAPGGSETARLPVPAFARAVRLQGVTPARFADAFFNQYGPDNAIITSRPMSDFAAGFVPLNNRAVEYTLQGGAAGHVDPCEVTFEIFQ